MAVFVRSAVVLDVFFEISQPIAGEGGGEHRGENENGEKLDADDAIGKGGGGKDDAGTATGVHRDAQTQRSFLLQLGEEHHAGGADPFQPEGDDEE